MADVSEIDRRAQELGAKSFGLKNRLFRILWGLTWFCLGAWSQPLHGWRRFLLRLFGATVGQGVYVAPSARIWHPGNLVLHDFAAVADEADIYNMAPVTIGKYAVVSKRAHLCAGSHDINDDRFLLIAKPVTLEAYSWVAAEAFVGPGVTIGEGAVLGARGVTAKDLAPWTVFAGNPARALKERARHPYLTGRRKKKERHSAKASEASKADRAGAGMLASGKQGETSAGGADTARIGPFAIARLHLEEAVSLVRTSVEQRAPLDIAICNAHTVLTALDTPEYAETLKKMTLLNDGIGINLASRFLEGRPFPANLNGTDLLPSVLAGIGIPLRIYLLGAREDQVRGAMQHIETTYPDHQVVGCRNGFFRDEETAGICAEINATRPDLLLVAMGNPRQEFFITQNRDQLTVPVAVGVGALFDFMSGAVFRAPGFVRKAGLEWLFRLLQEPRRLFHRYVIGIPRFLFAVARFKYGGSDKKV
eukprot:g954.t1